MTTDAFRLDQKTDRSVPGYERVPLKERGSKGRRAQDVRRRGTFHKWRALSIKRGGNTHCHVITSPCEGTGHRSDQLSRHPEIAKFDNSFTGQEDI